MDVESEVGQQDCRLVDNMLVYCERREAATAGNVGYETEKAQTRVL